MRSAGNQSLAFAPVIGNVLMNQRGERIFGGVTNDLHPESPPIAFAISLRTGIPFLGSGLSLIQPSSNRSADQGLRTEGAVEVVTELLLSVWK